MITNCLPSVQKKELCHDAAETAATTNDVLSRFLTPKTTDLKPCKKTTKPTDNQETLKKKKNSKRRIDQTSIHLFNIKLGMENG